MAAELDDRAALEREKLAAEQRDADLLAVMQTAWGRRFMMRLLRGAHVGELSYRAELTHATAFNEGVRDMGCKLELELKRVCFELWLLMHRENPPANLVHRGSDASAS